MGARQEHGTGRATAAADSDLTAGNGIRYECDVLVIGSGVSGYCAAIQAAREGCEVILLEKDEVLGGNSGPNLGVGITGADRYNAFGTETGLIQELQEEAAWVNGFTRISAGTMPYNISRRNEAVVQSALEQAGVRVLKRHFARASSMQGSRIRGVLAEDLAAFRSVEVMVNGVVVEASGDGHIGAQAGAEFAFGSEGTVEYGERSAPAEPRSWVQGTSLVALARKTDRPVEFISPPGTGEFTPRLWHGRIASYIQHGHGKFSGDSDLIFLYITEAGGDLDTIRDDGQIYELLLGQLWAEWDHIKNGPHREESANWDLLWVSPKAGKRESRRFLGDMVLTQSDLEAGRRFEDDIAYGGHDLDDHQSLGAAGSNIFGHSIPPMYGIPLRSCYSRNLDNLLLAGRLISASHLAHSSTRLMRTGGAIGQAVGLAAAMCCAHGLTPRQLYEERLDELQRRLLQGDGTILGRALDDPEDLARSAIVSASSEVRFNDQQVGRLVPMVAQAGNLLWDWPQRLDQVEVYLKNDSDQDQQVRLTVHRARRDPPWTTAEIHHEMGWNDLRDTAFQVVAEHEFSVPGGFEGWRALAFAEPLELGLKDAASDADRVVIALSENRAVWWGLSQDQPEICEMIEHSHHDTCWHALGTMGTMRLHPSVPLGEATNVVNGYHRRFSRAPTNMWMSRTEDALPQEITLTWDECVSIGRVDITFDNLAASRADNPWESGERVLPMLAKAYDLSAKVGDEWVCLVEEDQNIHRFRTHRFEPVLASQLRLRVLATTTRGASRVVESASHVPPEVAQDKVPERTSSSGESDQARVYQIAVRAR